MSRAKKAPVSASDFHCTPGPWERGFQGGQEVVLSPSQLPYRRVICRVDWPHDSLIQGANANLITASLDLLAVAREAYRIHVCCCSTRDSDLCLKCQAEKAIAKARGTW